MIQDAIARGESKRGVLTVRQSCLQAAAAAFAASRPS
jgi:hypothetical protein